ncbi:MAG: pyridoxal phosphate-dependent aminotransferase [Fusobacteriaceae bacterium]|nr:pyridoxal phosphate-dependent aminotransferase [Fusobacteriaceae bacterium]
MNFSNRIQEMNFSPIRKLMPFADAAEKKGIKVYKLQIGQPNIAAPDSFFEGLHNYEGKIIPYSDSKGILPLRETFSKNYKKYGLSMGVDEILVTQGGSEAILFVMMAICNIGDEILIPEPFYSNYTSFTCFAGVKIVPIPTKIEDDFHLPNMEDIEKLITPKTRGILFSNPVNPTGTVYTGKEIETIGKVAKKHNLYIIADEVYRQFIYDESIEYTSVAQFKELENNTILVDSISKHYSACGARIGSIATKNKELLGYFLKLCQSRLCVSTMEQYAAANLINTTGNYVEDVRLEYKKRRDLMYGYLQNIPGVVCPKPCGALYIFAKLPVKESEKFAKWLLTDYSYENKTLMVAPGPGFYQTPNKGTSEVRLSFCISEDDIENGMIVLKNALEAYKNIEDSI